MYSIDRTHSRAIRIEKALAYKSILDQQISEKYESNNKKKLKERVRVRVEGRVEQEASSPVSATSPFRKIVAHGGEIITQNFEQEHEQLSQPQRHQPKQEGEQPAQIQPESDFNSPSKPHIFRKTYAHGGSIVNDDSYFYHGPDFDKNTISPSGR